MNGRLQSFDMLYRPFKPEQADFLISFFLSSLSDVSLKTTFRNWTLIIYEVTSYKQQYWCFTKPCFFSHMNNVALDVTTSEISETNIWWLTQNSVQRFMVLLLKCLDKYLMDFHYIWYRHSCWFLLNSHKLICNNCSDCFTLYHQVKISLLVFDQISEKLVSKF